MTRAARLFAVASFSLLVPACGSPDPGSVDDYINARATASCDFEFRCCTDAEIASQEMMKFKDQATCVKFRQLAMENTLYAERLAVRQGRIKVDSDNAKACIAAANALACNPKPGAPPPPPTMPGTVDPCTLVFKGNTAVGDACDFANECIKGAHCVATGAGGHGVCVPYQEEAQICNLTTDCDPTVFNLYCAQKDFQCHLRSAVGGPCAYTIDPATMMPGTPLLLECDNSTGQSYCDPATSTCKALPTAGQPCLASPRPPGVNQVCALGLTCDMPAAGGAGTCRAPGAVGEDCTRVACQSTLYCDRSVTPNTCKTPPTVGEMCGGAAGIPCAKPYYCNTSMAPAVCAAPAALGQPCPGFTLCDTGLYCDTSMPPATCKSQLPDGSMCTQPRQCQSNNCTFTGGIGSGVCTPGTVPFLCTGR